MSLRNSGEKAEEWWWWGEQMFGETIVEILPNFVENTDL
jgi:hypothetical protein